MKARGAVYATYSALYTLARAWESVRANKYGTYGTAVARAGRCVPGRCVGEKLLYEGGRPDRRPARFLAGE